jgi:hypothetical protein
VLGRHRPIEQVRHRFLPLRRTSYAASPPS